MSDAVIITICICVTLGLITAISNKNNKKNKESEDK